MTDILDTVTRYGPQTIDGVGPYSSCCEAVMQPFDDGEWVRYEDYASLRQRHADEVRGAWYEGAACANLRTITKLHVESVPELDEAWLASDAKARLT